MNIANDCIVFENVSKSFGGQDILTDISFAIPQGSICGIVGSSGSGKTTLLNTLIGFIPLDHGSIKVHTQDKLKDIHRVNKKIIGFSSQRPSFYTQLTIQENAEYFASLFGVKKKLRQERIDKLLQQLGLTSFAQTPAGQLSGGMQKRFDIVLALLHDPDIIVLDEPTADLDPVLRRNLWSAICEINSMGKTVVVSSHILEDIDQYCDYVGVLHKTKLLHFCTPKELAKLYALQTTIDVTLPEQHIAKLKEFIDRRKKTSKTTVELSSSTSLEIATNAPLEVLNSITSFCKKRRISLTDVTLKKSTLQSVFEAIVEEEDTL